MVWRVSGSRSVENWLKAASSRNWAKLELQTTANGFDGLGLGGTTDTGDRQTDRNSRADTLVEQVGFQEDLAVGDRDDVGRDVGRDITGLGFDDWQGSQRTGAKLVDEFGGALQQAGVQVEDIARIGFAARWAAQQQ